MILTGKTKEDFEKCLKKQPFSNFNNYTKHIIIHNKVYTDLNELFINALIIEWFDSVGYIIIIGHNSLIKKFYYCIEKIFYDCGTQSTRQEATIEAIKKANELYNLKNK